MFRKFLNDQIQNSSAACYLLSLYATYKSFLNIVHILLLLLFD